MKRVVKSVMANLFCGILILGICGCGGGAQQSTDVQASEESAVGTSASAEKTVRISVASATEINMPDYISCKDGSTLEILKYPDSMLGSDHDMIQGCQAGTISVFIGSATVSIDTVPELALLSVPYLMNDYDQYQEVLQSTWKAWFQPYYQKKRFAAVDLALRLRWLPGFDSSCSYTERSQNIKSANNEESYRENYWAGLGVNVFSLTYDEIAYIFRLSRSMHRRQVLMP